MILTVCENDIENFRELMHRVITGEIPVDEQTEEMCRYLTEQTKLS